MRTPADHRTSLVCNDLSSRGMNPWWLVEAVMCLRVRGCPELWHTSSSLQWERDGGGWFVFGDGGGEKMNEVEEEEEGCLTP